MTHGFEQVLRTDDVVAPVEVRFLNGLADIAERGEVHDGIGLMGLECSGKAGWVEQVTFDGRPELHRVSPTCREVVKSYRFVPGSGECLAGMAADIASAARDQNRRHSGLFGCQPGCRQALQEGGEFTAEVIPFQRKLDGCLKVAGF